MLSWCSIYRNWRIIVINFLCIKLIQHRISHYGNKFAVFLQNIQVKISDTIKFCLKHSFKIPIWRRMSKWTWKSWTNSWICPKWVNTIHKYGKSTPKGVKMVNITLWNDKWWTFTYQEYSVIHLVPKKKKCIILMNHSHCSRVIFTLFKATITPYSTFYSFKLIITLSEFWFYFCLKRGSTCFFHIIFWYVLWSLTTK